MERSGEVEGDGAGDANVTTEKGLWKRHIDRLRYRGKFEGRDVRVKDFVLPIVEIARYVRTSQHKKLRAVSLTNVFLVQPSVLFPALYYATQVRMAHKIEWETYTYFATTVRFWKASLSLHISQLALGIRY